MAEFYGKKHGDFFWHELTTPDARGAAAFYNSVLGWDVRTAEHPGMTYHFFRRDERDLAGIMSMEGPMWDGIPPHWMLYVAVEDVEASKREVEAAGGVVKYGPFEAPGVGRMMVITDPQGAVLTLIQPAPTGSEG
jgi:predicted enzyme related to lactoylglutathione lyase